MASSVRMLPRVVIVTRPTPWEQLVERAGTVGQAKFLLTSAGKSPDSMLAAHDRQSAAVEVVTSCIQSGRRHAHVRRNQLDRFVFEPDDIILAVGQDGLIPNVSKYLIGQIVAGINPDRGLYDGVLCQHDPAWVPALLNWCDSLGGKSANADRRESADRGHKSESPAFRIQPRTLALATREDGLSLRALNEVFCGHSSHQSARYTLMVDGKHERQSSSGVICATGTGCSGWVKSILRQRREPLQAVEPDESRLLWLSREPFPSVSTGTSFEQGHILEGAVIRIESEMASGGVVFADGIESDFMPFLEGQSLTIGIDPTPLRLVTLAAKPSEA